MSRARPPTASLASRLRRRLPSAAAVAIGLALGVGTAHANGRFPEAQAIESVPGSPQTLYLRATFGVLVSHDAGQSWRWICERALGYEGQWDPPIAATSDGRLWVGLEDGLVSTRDDGCTLDTSDALAGQTIKDLTTDRKGETLWAISGAPGKRSFVWRRAAQWERLAGIDDTNLLTIEVAPSRSSRVYVSGQPYTTIRGRIFGSDDGGATFRAKDNELPADGPFFIGAVDPSDPERLLVRHLHAKGSDLLLSRDGGETFVNVLSMTSAMFGFAKSADGKSYWAGSGLPEHGLFYSGDRGEHFASIAKQGVLCLHAGSDETLYLCENALAPGAVAIARSRDQGRTVVPLARFADIRGPIACDAPSSRARLCAESWPEVKALFEPRDAGTKERPRAGSRRSACQCDAIGGAVANREWTMLLVGLLTAWRRACSRNRR